MAAIMIAMASFDEDFDLQTDIAHCGGSLQRCSARTLNNTECVVVSCVAGDEVSRSTVVEWFSNRR